MIQGNFAIKIIDTMVERTQRHHPIVVYMPCMMSLVYLNEWLGKASSAMTSLQYAKVLQRFCNYLAEQVFPRAGQAAPMLHNPEWARLFKDPKWSPEDKEDKEAIRHLRELLEFWLYCDSETLTGWKTHRLLTRNWSRKPDGSRVSSPSNGTVDKESDVVTVFLDWVRNDMHVSTLWDGGRKKIKAAKSIEQRWLTGIVGSKEREVIDVNTNVFFGDDNDEDEPLSPSALAKRSQGNTYNFLYDDQMIQMIAAFADEVYGCIALTGYLTGVRPHENLAIPWFRKDPKTGMVFSADPAFLHDCMLSMSVEERKSLTISLEIFGKKSKVRTIQIPALGWLALMRFWEPLRVKRKALYKQREGKECPDWILWLNKKGEPLYYPPGNPLNGQAALKAVMGKFDDIASRRKNPLNIVFNQSLSYYTMRNTFTTNFVLRYMESKNNYNEGDYLKDITLQKELADQLGHEDFDTTLKHYLVNSVILRHAIENGTRPRGVFTFEKMVESMRKRKSRKKLDETSNKA